jgi:hypothetical protein
MQAQLFIFVALLVVATLATNNPDTKVDRHLLVTTMEPPTLAATTASSAATPSMRFRRSETESDPHAQKPDQSSLPKQIADEYVQPGSVKSQIVPL